MSRKLEERIAELGQLHPSDPDTEETLRRALADSSNHLVAKAASVVGKHGFHALTDDLIMAFERFMHNPERTDKGCTAKTGVIKALNDLNYTQNDELFLRGVRHVQMEPVFGGRADTAHDLRANSLFGLARLNYPDLLFIVTDCLTDVEMQPRLAAVQVLREAGTEFSEVLLRFKVTSGDDDPGVLDACFSALMAIDKTRNTPFVARYLLHDQITVAQGAAFALGEARTLAALNLLQEAWERSIEPEFQSMLLLPIAVTRMRQGFDFLLQIVREASYDQAAAALQALKIHVTADNLNRIRGAVNYRQEAKITRLYRELFTSGNQGHN